MEKSYVEVFAFKKKEEGLQLCVKCSLIEQVHVCVKFNGRAKSVSSGGGWGYVKPKCRM